MGLQTQFLENSLIKQIFNWPKTEAEVSELELTVNRLQAPRKSGKKNYWWILNGLYATPNLFAFGYQFLLILELAFSENWTLLSCVPELRMNYTNQSTRMLG